MKYFYFLLTPFKCHVFAFSTVVDLLCVLISMGTFMGTSLLYNLKIITLTQEMCNLYENFTSTAYNGLSAKME